MILSTTGSLDLIYNNMRYLNGIVNDIKTGKAHFAEHDLLEDENGNLVGRNGVILIEMISTSY